MDPRTAVAAAKEQGADAIIVDGKDLKKDDIEFLLGAREYGGFGLILIRAAGDDVDIPGFDGICSRSAGFKELLLAIEAATGVVRPGLTGPHASSAYQAKARLTNREFEVAALIAKGYTNREISDVLQQPKQTVDGLARRVTRKLNCENRVQVALRMVNTIVESR